MKKQQKRYLPNERGYLGHKPWRWENYAKRRLGIAEPGSDPIVANNIANVEFDYTYNRGEAYKDNQ